MKTWWKGMDPRRWSAALAGAALAGLCSAAGQDEGGQALPAGGREGAPERFAAIGSLQAPRVTHLGSQVPGRIAQVLVDVGSPVKKGDPLVRLDPVFFRIEARRARDQLAGARAQVAAAQQGIETARAQVDLAATVLADAELHLKRMKNLWDKPEGEAPTIPKRLYDDALYRQREAAARVAAARSRQAEAKIGLDVARAAEAQAGDALRLARRRLAETVIRAPYDGVLTRRWVDPGEMVASAPPTRLLEVQEIRRLELEFALPQRLMGRVAKGTRVRYAIEGLAKGAGEAPISVIFPALDEATRSLRCRVLVDNPDLLLRPGLLVRVEVALR